MSRVYHDKRRKFEYVLNSYIFCSHCGYRMTGNTPSPKIGKGKRYYRHSRGGDKPCPLHHKPLADAEKLERAILRQLFDTFGNVAAVERAIRAAIPNQDEVIELRKQQTQVQQSLDNISRAKRKVLDAIADDVISRNEAKEKMESLREREAEQKEKWHKIQTKLDHLPSEASIRVLSDNAATRIRNSLFPTVRRNRRIGLIKHQVNGRTRLSADLLHAVDELDSPDDIDEAIDGMSYDDRRSLIESIFDGLTTDKQAAGVYVEWVPQSGRRLKCTYAIRGVIDLDGIETSLNGKHSFALDRKRNANAWCSP